MSEQKPLSFDEALKRVARLPAKTQKQLRDELRQKREADRKKKD